MDDDDDAYPELLQWDVDDVLACFDRAGYVFTFRDGVTYMDGHIFPPLRFRGGVAYLELPDGLFGAVPALGAAVAALPKTTVSESDAAEDQECAVCMEGYEAGAAVKTMPCSHAFHERCIVEWLYVSRLCPLCRFALPPAAV
ncbi:hypothetical protein EJB05_55036, partial [Eragrostis curvula]